MPKPMNLADFIHSLQKIASQYGGDTKVKFDGPVGKSVPVRHTQVIDGTLHIFGWDDTDTEN